MHGHPLPSLSPRESSWSEQEAGSGGPGLSLGASLDLLLSAEGVPHSTGWPRTPHWREGE